MDGDGAPSISSKIKQFGRFSWSRTERIDVAFSKAVLKLSMFLSSDALISTTL